MYAVFNKSKLTMHTDKVYLGKIPIKKTTKEKQKEIINLVRKINQGNIKKLLPELDKKVYKLYGLTKTEQYKINMALKQIMSEKSLW